MHGDRDAIAVIAPQDNFNAMRLSIISGARLTIAPQIESSLTELPERNGAVALIAPRISYHEMRLAALLIRFHPSLAELHREPYERISLKLILSPVANGTGFSRCHGSGA